jgi:hypothetical protein
MCLKPRPHSSQLCLISSSCFSVWVFKCSFVRNFWPQRLQEKGFSPRIFFQENLKTKSNLKILYKKPVCVNEWAFKFEFLLNFLKQTGHWWGRIPMCRRTWYFKSSFRMYFLPHVSHSNLKTAGIGLIIIMIQMSFEMKTFRKKIIYLSRERFCEHTVHSLI